MNSRAQNFILLFKLRTIAILTILAVICGLEFFSEIKLRFAAHITLIALLLLINARARCLFSKEISNKALFLFLLYDTLIFAGHIYLSNGVVNPFIGFLILPIILANIVLSRIYAGIIITVSITLYFLLYFYYLPLEFKADNPPDFFFKLHMLGMLISFGIIALTITAVIYFLMKILKEQNDELTNYKTDLLQASHLKNLGIFTSNAAHQLSTPLTSINLLADNLQNELGKKRSDKNKMSKQLKLISNEISRSKNLIQNILKKTEQKRSFKLSSVKLGDFCTEILEEWQEFFPNVNFTFNCSTKLAKQKIISSDSLKFALFNLLDNAAQAASKKITITLSTNNTDLLIKISNNKTAQHRSHQGHGYGLKLSNLVITELAGQLDFSENATEHQIMINIPKDKIFNETS